MSKKGHGPATGGALEQNFTPRWCVDRLLEVWTPPKAGVFLEAGAGDGAIIRAVSRRVAAFWHAIEIDGRYKTALYNAGAGIVTIGDYLRTTPTNVAETTLSMGNHPFSLAQAFIEHTMKVYPHAEIVQLMRLDFLATVDRHPLVSGRPPDMFVLPNRPSFTADGGTDAQEYAWFRWLPGMKQNGTVRVLQLTSIEERKRG